MTTGRRSLVLRRGCAALALGVLFGCAVAPPPPAPVAVPRPAPAPALPEPSSESLALTAYYARVQADLLSQGLLRTDGQPKDAPFTDTMLTENFIRIALFDEYRRTSGGLLAQETASRLRRWAEPVRLQVHFGASVPQSRRATDRARIGSYLARLSQITGHPIALADQGANFHLHVVNEDERRALGPVIRSTLPDLSTPEVAGLTNLPRSTYCIVYALSEGVSSTYTRAFAVVRAEHPDLLRLSCMHEEIAQGLGLANDSPLARPSIFNDDEEFALLTRQDELMLKILYDPALQPGMTAQEARPVVRAIAARLLGGAS
ncbi:DUF2927 domain-containing protein [Gemmobacter denitrificans]|uniref:DUF2927 domain-containing protein n=1 Tax=Gemmobacter denitrificans TaxID=3123040 RepID=A0ABU8BUV1_9RHOB